MSKRTGFYFFDGYYDAINSIKSKSKRWDVFDAFYNYAVKNKLNKVNELDVICRALFMSFKPLLKKYKNNDGRLISCDKGGSLGKKVLTKSDNDLCKNSNKVYETIGEIDGKKIHRKFENFSENLKKSQKFLDAGGGDINIIVNKNKNKEKNVKRNLHKEKARKEKSEVFVTGSDFNEMDDLRHKTEGVSLVGKSASEALVLGADLSDDVVSLKEVEIFVRENDLVVDGEVFYNFYKSKGWMVGKNKLVDWKSKLREWHVHKVKDLKSKSKVSKDNFMVSSERMVSVGKEVFDDLDDIEI